jgi:hypothetical protein
MVDAWKRLTPHELRWMAIGTGVLFAVVILLSDFSLC